MMFKTPDWISRPSHHKMEKYSNPPSVARREDSFSSLKSEGSSPVPPLHYSSASSHYDSDNNDDPHEDTKVLNDSLKLPSYSLSPSSSGDLRPVLQYSNSVPCYLESPTTSAEPSTTSTKHSILYQHLSIQNFFDRTPSPPENRPDTRSHVPRQISIQTQSSTQKFNNELDRYLRLTNDVVPPSDFDFDYDVDTRGGRDIHRRFDEFPSISRAEITVSRYHRHNRRMTMQTNQNNTTTISPNSYNRRHNRHHAEHLQVQMMRMPFAQPANISTSLDGDDESSPPFMLDYNNSSTAMADSDSESLQERKKAQRKRRALLRRLPTFLISDVSDLTQVQEECSICLDRFKLVQNVRKLPCGHMFHKQCVDRWLIVHASCPYCKAEICEQCIG